MKFTKERLSLDNVDNFRSLINHERSGAMNFVTLGAVGTQCKLSWTPLPAAERGRGKKTSALLLCFPKS